MAEKMETIISLKDEMTSTASRVAAAYDNVGGSADKMAKDVEKAEGRLSKMKSALGRITGSHKVKVEPVNLDAVSGKVEKLENQLSALTGRPVTISATAKVSNKEIKAAQAEAKALKKELEAMTGKKYTVDVDVNQSGGGIKGALSGIGSIAKSAAPAAIAAAATAGISSMVSMGSERQQYRNNMEFFLGSEKDANSMMDWATQNAAKTQYSAGEVMGATSRAIQISDGDMGEAKKFVQLAEDMASLTPGKTISDAMEALADAQLGEFERMKEFGYKGSAEAFEAAGGDFWAMKSTSNGKTVEEMFSGGTEAGLESSAAKLGTIMGNFEDAIGTAGEKLLNGLSPALDWLIDKSAGWSETLSALFEGVGSTLTNVWNALTPFAPVLQLVASVIGGVVTTAFTAVGAVINDVAVPAFQWIGDKVTPIMEKLRSAAEVVSEKFGEITGVVKDAIGAFADIPSKIASGISGIGGSIMNAIKGAIGIGKNAQGTLNFDGGFTQMNENGRGEIVALPQGAKIYPYSTTEKIIRKMIGASNIGRTGSNNVVNVNIDARGSNMSRQDQYRMRKEIVKDILSALDNTVPA